MKYNRNVILVVEDDHLIRMTAVQILVSAGFNVYEAGTADEAICTLEARPDIHLVFTDVQMPSSKDGIKLCHYIQYRGSPIKLIVASGKNIFDKSQLPDGTGFFTKPYDQISVISNMLSMLA